PAARTTPVARWFTAAAPATTASMTSAPTTRAQRCHTRARRGASNHARPTGTSSRLAWLATWMADESAAADASYRPGRWGRSIPKKRTATSRSTGIMAGGAGAGPRSVAVRGSGHAGARGRALGRALCAGFQKLRGQRPRRRLLPADVVAHGADRYVAPVPPLQPVLAPAWQWGTRARCGKLRGDPRASRQDSRSRRPLPYSRQLPTNRCATNDANRVGASRLISWPCIDASCARYDRA